MTSEFPAGFGSGESVPSLAAKLSAAQELAKIIGGSPKDGGSWRPTEVLQAVTETAAARRTSETSYRQAHCNGVGYARS